MQSVVEILIWTADASNHSQTLLLVQRCLNIYQQNQSQNTSSRRKPGLPASQGKQKNPPNGRVKQFNVMVWTHILWSNPYHGLVGKRQRVEGDRDGNEGNHLNHEYFLHLLPVLSDTPLAGVLYINLIAGDSLHLRRNKHKKPGTVAGLNICYKPVYSIKCSMQCNLKYLTQCHHHRKWQQLPSFKSCQ